MTTETVPLIETTPGLEKKAERGLRGLGSVYERGRVWWIKYHWRGQVLRESSKSAKRSDAVKLLKRRLQEIGKGRFIDPRAEERVTMAQLFDAVVTDYQNNQRRSLATLTHRLVPLRAAFNLDRALDVDEPRIERYKAERLGSKRRGNKPVAPGTVNRELAALRRAFSLAVKHKLLSRAPVIEMLEEAPPREGFVEPAAFERLVPHLPEYLRDFARCAYTIGWRKGALRGLTWDDVDRASRRMYLRRAGSKNKKPYVIVLTGALAALIERRWAARKVTREDGTTFLSEYVFHQGDGAPIGDFRKVWKHACTAAKLPGLLFHDFRRSAARNLRRARGIGAEVGMKITGHETDSMWRRYSIVSEDDIEQALTAVQVYQQTAAATGSPSNVVNLSEARR